jgi:hypothetical protein
MAYSVCLPTWELAALSVAAGGFFTHAFGTTQSGYLAFSISLLSMTGASLKPIGLIMLPHATTMIAEKITLLLHSQIRKMIFYFLLLSAIVIAGYELLAPALISLYLGKANPQLVYISRIVMAVGCGLYVLRFFQKHYRCRTPPFVQYRQHNYFVDSLDSAVICRIFFNVSRTYLLSIFVLSVSFLAH